MLMFLRSVVISPLPRTMLLLRSGPVPTVVGLRSPASFLDSPRSVDLLEGKFGMISFVSRCCSWLQSAGLGLDTAGCVV
jgi:hypothetical protein